MSRVLDLWAGMTGTVMDFAGATAPNGWLLCYGQSLLRTDYPALFAAIGTTYGAADGTHFTMPDCRGRVGAGKDNMGGSAASRLTTAGAAVDGTTLGASGGAQTHQLTTAQLPSHSHQVFGATSSGAGGSVINNGSGGSTYAYDHVTATTGSDTAHNNTQPTIVFNKIIKT